MVKLEPRAFVRTGCRWGVLLWGVCCLSLLVGCQNRTYTPVDTGPDDTPSPEPLPPALKLTPAVVGVGQQSISRLTAVSFTFDETTELNLGDGVAYQGVQRISPTELELTLTASADAALGYRTVEARTGDQTVTLPDGLLVQVGVLEVSPSLAPRGQTVEVDVNVKGLVLTPGYTGVDFGEGTTVERFDVLDSYHGVAQVLIESNAPVGPRDVSLNDGPTRIVLPGGFTIDRPLTSITFEPSVASQGQDVAFTITGYGTQFQAGSTQIDLGLGILAQDPDSGALQYAVNSPTQITGVVHVCESAVTGLHDVTVSTTGADGRVSSVVSRDAFTVKEVPVPITNTFASLSMAISRSMRDGVISESISVFAVFYGAVERCSITTSTGTSCSVQTLPYDQPSYYPPEGCTPTSGSSTQSPPTPTFDAGEQIWLEVPGGPSIVLDRFQEGDGQIYYQNRVDLSPDNFWFDAGYDLRVDGGNGDQAIPPFVAEEVILTPPRDFVLVEPALEYAPSLDRYDSIVMRWEDQDGNPGAGSFPVASIFARLRTLDGQTGETSEVRVIPEDDGEYVFPANYVSELYPGQGRLLIQVSRTGIPFVIPGSSYVSYGAAGVSWDGYFELR